MRSWSVPMIGFKGKCQKRDVRKPALTFKKAWGLDMEWQSQVQNWEDNNVLTLGSLQKPRKEMWGKREVKLKVLNSQKQHAELSGLGQGTKSHTLWKASKHSAVLPWLPQICKHWLTMNLGKRTSPAPFMKGKPSQKQWARFQWKINELLPRK